MYRLEDHKWDYNFSNDQLVVGDYHPHTPLSKHFKFYEMVRSQTADNNRILNMPTLEQIDYAKALATNVLDPIREEFGVIVVNSWFRCETLERVIAKRGYERWCRKYGYAQTELTWKAYFSRKQHPKCIAADIEARSSKVSNSRLFHWIKDNLNFDQVILENVTNSKDPRSGWVHVSYNPVGENRQEALLLNGQ